MDELSQAVRSVERGEAARICKPGVWRVWRDDDGGVHWELFGVYRAGVRSGPLA